MKKNVILLFLVLTVFASCAKEKMDENEISIIFPALSTTSADGEVDVTGKQYYLMKQIVEKEMPGTTLKLYPLQAPVGEYYTKVALALRSEDIYDIVFEDSFMVQSDAAAGFLAPLDVENWSEWQKFYKAGRDASTVNGKVYTVPFETANVGIWYNRALIERIGYDSENWQPTNWAQILDVARKMKALGTHNGKEIVPFSANFSKANGESTTMHTFLMLLYGTDDKLYEDEKWIVESQGILDSLNFIKTLRDENLILPNDVLLTAGYWGYVDPLTKNGSVGRSQCQAHGL